MELEDLMIELGGVASTTQIAAFYGLSHVAVRAWASENGVPMIGNAFAFTETAAQELAADLFDEDGEEWEEDDSQDECEDEWLGGEDEDEDDECGASDDDFEEEEEEDEDEWDDSGEDDQHAAAAYYE